MEKVRVNEKKRVVRAYKEDMEDDVIFNRISKYEQLGYKAIITAKPKKYHSLKNDMIKYLEGNIDDDLYIEFIDRIEKKEKFLKVKWWLEKELEEKLKKTPEKKEDILIIQIINKAKSKENRVIEKAKEEATLANKKDNENE